ncbi:hypothetical protein EKE94_03290 [Mesobaculum littorinae]|uniref:Uncharacterized protein n=1 Tax=Mesobaculum littorinae TaxID=2486419 RepID=A0A438AMA5_9RHOB|nr:hypothetical protein [Mesobaculum littorinae]RVV99717.1 hypothetical protein EKE94_03290 [Mesobaculum littorinae]
MTVHPSHIRQGLTAEAVPVPPTETARPYLKLWRSALAELIATAEGAGALASDLETYHAQAWIGTRDFHTVCALAGLDGEEVLTSLRRRGVPGA